MKHMMKFVAVLIFTVGFASCDLLNVDVESTFTGALDIAVDEGVAKGAVLVPPYPFHADTTLEIDDPEVEKYKDNIVNVEVDGVVAEVVSVEDINGDPIDGVAFLEGSTFFMSNGVDNASYKLPADWAIVPGAKVYMDDFDGFYHDVSAILTNVEDFDLKMDGFSSKNGVFVSLKIDIDVTITGSPF